MPDLAMNVTRTAARVREALQHDHITPAYALAWTLCLCHAVVGWPAPTQREPLRRMLKVQRGTAKADLLLSPGGLLIAYLPGDPPNSGLVTYDRACELFGKDHTTAWLSWQRGIAPDEPRAAEVLRAMFKTAPAARRDTHGVTA